MNRPRLASMGLLLCASLGSGCFASLDPEVDPTGSDSAAYPVSGVARVRTPDGVIEMAYANVDGLAVAGGDMVLGTIAEVSGTARSAANVTAGQVWPATSPIYYDFDANLPQGLVDTAKAAVADWRANTTMDLRPADGSSSDVIRFTLGTGCKADIGRKGGVQRVWIDSSCGVGVTKHEIGHSMGLLHEQTRQDRDSYVIYRPECVQSGQEHNFDKYSTGADLGPYDFGSIMHYGSTDFCKDLDGVAGCDCLPLTRRDGSTIVANKTSLSEGDLWGIGQIYGPRVGSQGVWSGSFAINPDWPNAVKTTGDFNGDGKDDVVAFLRNTTSGALRGHVHVALSTGTSFGVEQDWNPSFCMDTEQCATGDVNGDGKDDIVAFTPWIGAVWVATSNGSSFVGVGNRWKDGFCYSGEICRVGDVNGDKKADLISFSHGWAGAANQGDVYVSLSTGSGFGPRTKVQDFFCIEDETCDVADMTGDGRADLVLTRRDGVVYWAAGQANGTFATPVSAQPGATCVNAKACAVADANGDGRADIISFWGNTRSGVQRGDVRIARRSSSPYTDGFRPERFAHGFFCVDNEQCGTGDFNGDGRADLITFTPNANQAIWVARSAAPFAGEY